MNVVIIVVVKVFVHIIELSQGVENVMVVVFANIVVEDLDALNVVKINTYAPIIDKKHFVMNAVDRRYALIINIKLGANSAVVRKYAHIINTNNGVLNAISL
jgi:hypothetical protein